MNGIRRILHRSGCWLMVSTLAMVAACAGTKPLPASEAAPAPAVVTPAMPEGTADASPVSPEPAAAATSPVIAEPTASTARAIADRKPAFDVPYWPTPQPVVEKMLELAKVKSTDIVYDLGCGDARSLVTAAQRHGATGFGFDIDVRLVEKARENVRSNGVENLVQIELRDMFSLDLSKADVVFLYLLDRTLEQLMPQLETMRPGSRIVTHEYPLPDVKPAKTVRLLAPPDGPPGTDEAAAKRVHTLQLWKLPLRKQANRARAK